MNNTHTLYHEQHRLLLVKLAGVEVCWNLGCVPVDDQTVRTDYQVFGSPNNHDCCSQTRWRQGEKQ